KARELLQRYHVATTRGKVAATLDEAEQIARELGDVEIVVKAQIHAGGRGKGAFKNGFKGGVHIRKTPQEVREVAAKMLGQILITHQTGPTGRVVNKVLVAESAEIAREIYFAVLLDRATAAPLIVASSEGGVDIETVAAKSPEKIIREPIDPLAGLQPFQTRKVAKQLGFESSQLKSAAKLFEGLYRTFVAFDCSMVEVNPLVVTTKGDVLALDAKFNFDDNALYRHPEIAAMRDVAEEDPREVEASKHGRSYIGLDGNIACLVNGAGLAMATMDIIKFYGGDPANFLDVGGGATEEQVTEAFNILIVDKKVKALLVIAATLRGEELPHKAKTPRESYPNVDVVYDSVTAPDGKRLRTIITKPRNAKGKLPVIFVAGWLSCDSVEAPAGTKDATGLVFQGLAHLPQFSLFRVDKQGIGDSEGVCAETDFESELGGYRAAFRALKNYEFIDTNRVFVLGISNGGGFAPLVPESPAEQQQVRGYISVGG